MNARKALLTLPILLLVLTSPSSSAACDTDPERGLLCGDDVPDFPGWREVCKDGCFLVTPEFERNARFHADQVKLIPRLRIQVLELGGLLYQMHDDRQAAGERIEELEEALLDLRGREGEQGWGLEAFVWGVGVGVVVGVAGAGMAVWGW